MSQRALRDVGSSLKEEVSVIVPNRSTNKMANRGLNTLFYKDL